MRHLHPTTLRLAIKLPLAACCQQLHTQRRRQRAGQHHDPVFTALLSAITLSLLSSCWRNDGEFSTALNNKVRVEQAAEVDLSTISQMPWDELFVFGPYSLRERNCELLQLGWFACRITFPSSVSEGEHILVFRENKQVVHSERHARMNGDFSSRESKLPFPVVRSDARFAVVAEAAAAPQGLKWFRLDHKS